jgi:SulP family sulfate permease
VTIGFTSTSSYTAPVSGVMHTLREEVRGAFRDPVPNLLAGLTVAIVALPLALAFGLIAFGPVYGPAAGLWSAILAGFLAAMLGGSSYAITGPTGVLAVFTAGLVMTHGGFGSRDAILFGFLAVALSGVFQILFGVLRLAKVIEYIPYPVITGFMNGIALIIVWSGLQYVLKPDDGNAPFDYWQGAKDALLGHAPAVVYVSAALCALAFAVTWFYPKLARRWPDRGAAGVLKRIPGSLLALLVLTVAAVALAPLHGIRHIQALPSGAPRFALDLGLFARHPGWTQDLVLGALGLAAISSLDTLLTCVLADAVVGNKTKGNRELVAQGIANAVAGSFGANQACGAAVRTMVNVKNGGRTRLSGMSHALILLGILLLGAGLATSIPLAVLSGILLTTGVGMIEWRAVLEAHRAPKSDTFVMIVTTVAVVWLGLVEAVVVGVVLAAFLFIKRMTELTDFVGEPEWTGHPRAGLEGLEHDVLVYEIRGPLFFGPATRFTQTFERADLKRVRVVIFRMNAVTAIDETGLRALEVIVERLERNKQTVIFAHVPPQTLAKLERFGMVERVGAGNVQATLEAAVTRARTVLGSHGHPRAPTGTDGAHVG